jgi:signal peptidase I
MVPTLLVGDRVLVSKLNTDPGRGDVVVFNRPPNDPKRDPSEPDVLIKRVIGLPGETVTAQDGFVYVDGKKLVEDYLPASSNAKTVIQSAINVPNGQLLVLGDNRGISFDGRSFGTISKDLIVGRAVLRIWPLSRFGSI